jgi:hypothetical protein
MYDVQERQMAIRAVREIYFVHGVNLRKVFLGKRGWPQPIRKAPGLQAQLCNAERLAQRALFTQFFLRFKEQTVVENRR